MRWRRGQSSDYVVDRRGRGRTGGIAVGGLGGIGVVVFLLLQLLGGGGGGAGLDEVLGPLAAPPSDAGSGDTGGEADDELEDFLRAVMNDLQGTWTELFEADGRTYEPTQLVLFTDATSTGCGTASAATGPFYCPADRLAYIDLSFYRALRDRFGAPGDFAQAYVIAHEVGHHVQHLLGDLGGRESNAESVEVELQADCYAGVWANHLEDAGAIEDGDIAEALDAAAAVGDDRIQPGSSPESWTHGSSEQRTAAFQAGFESGRPAAC